MSDGDKYLICTFSPGMFSNEYAVEVDVAGTLLSLFAAINDVIVTDQESGKALLRVRVVDPDNEVISLPSETLGHGRRYYQYPLEKLQTA